MTDDFSRHLWGCLWLNDMQVASMLSPKRTREIAALCGTSWNLSG